MTDRVFIDTNLLIYADDADAGTKQLRAQDTLRRTIRDDSAVLSTQVLQEYYAVATRRLGIPADQARQRVEAYADLHVVIIHPELILAAIDLVRLRSISFWDALVVRSAQWAACSRLMTEDLQDGEVIEGLRIENPFLSASSML